MSEQPSALYNDQEDGHWWFKARRSILHGLLDRLGERDMRILEMGCGTGGNIKHLLHAFGKPAGLEFNAASIGFARRKLGDHADLVQADALNAPFADGSFQCVALFDLLDQGGISDPDALLGEAYRVLAPGGHLIMTGPAYDFLLCEHNRSVDTVRRFTRAKFCAQLKRVGFTIRHATYWGVSLFVLLLIKRRIVDRLFPPRPGTTEVTNMGAVDSVLYGLVMAETPLLRLMPLPFGASLAVLATKPGP